MFNGTVGEVHTTDTSQTRDGLGKCLVFLTDASQCNEHVICQHIDAAEVQTLHKPALCDQTLHVHLHIFTSTPQLKTMKVKTMHDATKMKSLAYVMIITTKPSFL